MKTILFLAVTTHQNDDYDVIISNWRWCHQKFSKISKDFQPSLFPTKFYHHLTWKSSVPEENDENDENDATSITFNSQAPPLISYHSNNEWSIPKFLIPKDDLLGVPKKWPSFKLK